MAKHTPGPWMAVRESEYESLIERQDGRTLGSVGGNGYADNSPEHAEIEANARLIAAAPELLEACRVVEAMLAAQKKLATPEQLALDVMRAAIARAEGTS